MTDNRREGMVTAPRAQADVNAPSCRSCCAFGHSLLTPARPVVMYPLLTVPVPLRIFVACDPIDGIWSKNSSPLIMFCGVETSPR